jgi:hypothetical protein
LPGTKKPNHEGPTRWGIQIAHQEGLGIQALGQAAEETQNIVNGHLQEYCKQSKSSSMGANCVGLQS